MHRISFRHLLVLLTFLAAAAAQAADRRESRPVAAFTAVSISAPIDVELVQSDRESLVLEGPGDIVAALETAVEGSTLHIRMKPAFTFARGRVKASLTARAIESIAISGSGNLASPALKSEALRIAIAGSGDVRIGRLDATRVDASIAGSGDIHAAGRADRLAVRIEGSGDLHGEDLEAREAKVSIAGSGDVRLWARDSLSASVAGSGDVRYRGEPRIERTVVGSGSVRPLVR